MRRRCSADGDLCGDCGDSRNWNGCGKVLPARVKMTSAAARNVYDGMKRMRKERPTMLLAADDLAWAYHDWLLRQEDRAMISGLSAGEPLPIYEPMPPIRCTTTPPCKWEPGCWYCQKAKESHGNER